MHWRSVLAPVAGLAAASCALLQPPAPPAPTGPAVQGKVDYRELELLPRGSTLEVTLVRTTSDGEEELVAEWSQLDPGQAPFDFELPYEPTGVAPASAYTVRARITTDTRRLFQTTDRFPVELWDEVQRIVELEATRREQALAAALAAQPEDGAEPVDEGAEPALAESGARPILDVGRIVLTKVPATAATARLPEVAYVRGRAETRLFERLPAGARLEVRLETLAEERLAGVALADWEGEFVGDVPRDFELGYDPARVEKGRRHGLRAEVVLDGATLYRTTSQLPVDLDAALERMRAVSLEGAPFPDELTVPNLRLVRVPLPPPTPEAASDPAEPVVRGRIHFRGQQRAPAGAVLELQLVGESSVDRTERELARATVEDPGPFPIEFGLPYDPQAVRADHTYFVRARISADGELLFKTTARFDVDFSAGSESAGAVDAGVVLVTPVPRQLEPVPDLEGPPAVVRTPVGLVNGRIVYLERRPLPRDAVLEVQLVATSPTARTDEVVGAVRDESPGQVPIDFTLEYDPEVLDAALEYTVRAAITSGDQKLYLTTRKFTVDLPSPPPAEEGAPAWQPPPTNAGNVLVTAVPR